jgi:hypothetical protein
VGVGCWSNGHVWKYILVHGVSFIAEYFLYNTRLFVVCENCVIIVL